MGHAVLINKFKKNRHALAKRTTKGEINPLRNANHTPIRKRTPMNIDIK